eukprot:gnl/TRDRNA2_/TRDRNA2_99715_c1_seq1.p1 gnl/TRDRNA2_/TRDRNA2_99715_c1~~gnl/TRDRNA2_/TRDRNA2_99715_c1_seq1.p1  ORF type:complete len:243 (-),score=41.46 gnl/TRDRNA2_/TRDRNA2_99715_c1_seq1:41-667(-)
MDRQMNSYEADSQKAAPPRKYEPMELLALQGPLILCFELLLSACLEGRQPYVALAVRFARSPTELCSLVAFTFLTALSAFILTCAGLRTMKLLGAPGMQIVGKLNILMVAMISAGLMHERVDSWEVLGGAQVLVGAYIFEWATSRHATNSAPAASGEQQDVARWGCGDLELEDTSTGSTVRGDVEMEDAPRHRCQETDTEHSATSRSG